MIKPLTIVTQNIHCNQEVLTLTNQRVMYWKTQESLILSDLHIGKAAHFQKSGIPIPSSILEQDLERLAQLIHHFKTKKLIIVGDLFHAEYNKDLDEFKHWLFNFKDLKLILIKGNHDRLKQAIYDDFNIDVYQPSLELEAIQFVHDIVETQNNVFTISGHTHPGVLLKGKGRQRIKLPCFQVTKNQLILPAFSLFTGLNTKNAPKNCTNYGFTEDAIFEV
ncbi:ligase-associated DNA damage response endonuclease PdeM [Polaribacter sp. R77954]|uniref:ligase-associated DNA damage response endonuclease PdeM n=1 Tax=Polaribacter sp. R77954 TaxID=3093870 RepID=UPI0037C5D6EA